MLLKCSHSITLLRSVNAHVEGIKNFQVVFHETVAQKLFFLFYYLPATSLFVRAISQRNKHMDKQTQVNRYGSRFWLAAWTPIETFLRDFMNDLLLLLLLVLEEETDPEIRLCSIWMNSSIAPVPQYFFYPISIVHQISTPNIRTGIGFYSIEIGDYDCDYYWQCRYTYFRRTVFIFLGRQEIIVFLRWGDEECERLIRRQQRLLKIRWFAVIMNFVNLIIGSMF